MIDGFGEARAFIKPFCSPDFDAVTEPFNLDTLEKQLINIRLVLLAKEGGS